MNSAEPFWVYSNKELEQLKSVMGKVISEWAGKWLPGSEVVVTSIGNAFDGPVPAYDSGWSLSDGNLGVVFLRWQQLLGLLCALPADATLDTVVKDDESARHLMLSAVRALVESITKRQPELEYGVRSSAKLTEYGYDGLQLGITLGGAQIIAYFTYSSISHHLRKNLDQKVSKLVALSSRKNAINHSTISLSAVLGDVEISIGDLSSIQKGDVLSFPVAVDGAVRLVNGSGDLVCNGNLGEYDGYRSLRIINEKENNQ